MTTVHSFVGIVRQPGLRQADAVCTEVPYDAGIFLFPTTIPAIGSRLVNNVSRDHHSANQNYVSLVVISAS